MSCSIRVGPIHRECIRVDVGGLTKWQNDTSSSVTNNEVRPPLYQQEAENVGLYVDPASEQIIVRNKYSFTFDHALPPTSSQALVYEKFVHHVRRFLEGDSVTLVAAGRLSSGKTHSLVGSLSTDAGEGHNCGIIPRVAQHMFEYIKANQTSGHILNAYFNYICENGGDTSMPLHPQPLRDPLDNNFTGKECYSLDDVMSCLNVVMMDNPFERYSYPVCYFMLTLSQNWIQAGELIRKTSRCTFIELGECLFPRSSDQVFRPIGVSGLNLISKALEDLAEERPHLASQLTTPLKVATAVVAHIIKLSSSSLILYCAPPSIMDSDLISDIHLMEQLRMLYGNQNFNKRTQNREMKHISHQERDSFKEEALSLEFAASQWQVLVSNAEVLFHKLVQSELSPDDKVQIEQWLFLKQECEDCFKPEVPGPEKIKCSLDRIDEVTESDSKTSLDVSGESEPDNYDSDEMEENCRLLDQCTLEQSEIKKRKLSEKLGVHMEKFRTVTDRLVCEQYAAKPIRHHGNEPNVNERNYFGFNRRAASVESLVQSITSEAEDCEGQSADEDELVEFDGAPDSSSNVKQIVPSGADALSDADVLRVEIANLRATKEYMYEQKRELTAKLNEINYISNEEERKLIEADEAIDAIDSALEFKNELICGRNGLHPNDFKDRGEHMLTERLLNLSPLEMRILLCKYFQKVVDLRESGRRMETVIADQDHQLETQTFKIHALGNALQQTRIECEHRLMMVLKEQEKKYQVNFHHFAAGSNDASSSVDNKSDYTSTNTGPLFEVNAGPSSTVADKALTTIPHQNLKKLQGPYTRTTKVTRKGNKLIIQQERSKKK